jgi:hypothetical protein
LQTSIMAVHAEWLHFAHLLILTHTFHLSNLVSLDLREYRCVA